MVSTRYVSGVVGLLGLLVLPLAQADSGVTDAKLTDTQFTFGGFVKLAALYSRYSDGAVTQGPGRDFYLPSSIPVVAGPGSPKQYFDSQAKETRLFFGVKGKLQDHSVGAYVEGDFISGQIPQTIGTGAASGPTTTTTGTKIATNAYNPALRRAYLTYDNWLFGQEWTTFQNTDVLPETTDFIGGVDGLVFVRQPQVRYTSGGFQASLESSDTTVASKTVTAFTGTNDNDAPDMVLRYNLAGSAGSYSAAVLLRQLRDSGTVGATTDTAIGEGLSLAGKVPLGTADVRFMLSSGKGIGRYLGLDEVGDALIDANSGELKALPVTAAFLALHLPLATGWTSNLILSQESANVKDTLAPAGTTLMSQSLALNAFYSPVHNLSFGTELRYGRREALTTTGTTTANYGSLKRVEFSAKYAF